MERRAEYIEMLDECLYCPIVELVKECLRNDQHERPSAEELLTRLQGMRSCIEREHGEGRIRLDMARLRLAKEVKMKDKRLVEQQVREMIELDLT